MYAVSHRFTYSLLSYMAICNPYMEQNCDVLINTEQHFLDWKRIIAWIWHAFLSWTRTGNSALFLKWRKIWRRFRSFNILRSFRFHSDRLCRCMSHAETRTNEHTMASFINTYLVATKRSQFVIKVQEGRIMAFFDIQIKAAFLHEGSEQFVKIDIKIPGIIYLGMERYVACVCQYCVIFWSIFVYVNLCHFEILNTLLQAILCTAYCLC